MTDNEGFTIFPPLGDGTWWVTYCAWCGIMCGQATDCETAARAQAASHTAFRRHLAARRTTTT